MATQDIYRYVLEAPEYDTQWEWITNDIALGSYPLNEALREILDAGVTAILSVRVDPPDYDLALFQRSLVISVEDMWPFPYDELAAAVRFLHESIRDGHKVYVHCFAGISRSPFVVASYLMLAREIPYSEALEVVQAARGVASPSNALREDGVLERLMANRDAVLGL